MNIFFGKENLLQRMNIAMAAFRAPTIALMPDLTPSADRSKANGVINFMGGALIFFFGLTHFPPGPVLPPAGAAMLLALLILLFIIKERQDAFVETEQHPAGLMQSVKQVPLKRNPAPAVCWGQFLCGSWATTEFLPFSPFTAGTGPG